MAELDEIDAILSFSEPSEPAPEDVPVEQVGLEAATDGMLAAIQAGDRAGLQSALERAFEMMLAAREREVSGPEREE